jgi:hemolysin-activating ACP:hemolysin acyltransferase
MVEDVHDSGTAGNGGQQPRLDPEKMAKLVEARAQFEARVGQIVLVLTNLPRYRHQTLADLAHLVLDPLARDRIAVATAKGRAVDDALAGIAIWATVSDEVDRKISEQVKGGAFPVRLKSQDWTSGDTVWLLDVIAPNRELATAVLINFRQLAEERQVRIHPIVARSVDRELLEKMRVKPEGLSEELQPGP